ncbi:unnamed protein product [Medioppia subpectinata]|uniref:PXA domain-containing protein n=1 Tax=Medioppia subpectinata TaxID=1979941 RepID=A0A7R9KJS2_9ACAR|nr:unnamed protein product [Medioppia subpectinata]CAG2104968.1 unnamed protein product [Medioppia subpectinata]
MCAQETDIDSNDSKTLAIEETDKEVDNFFRTRSLVSTNVDQLLDQLIDFCLRDFVFLWYKDLTDDCDHQTIHSTLKNDFYEIIVNIVRRMASIDSLKFFTHNIVNRCLKHFQKITICLSGKDNQNNVYLLSTHLAEDKELEFIRKLNRNLLEVFQTSIDDIMREKL